MDIQQLLDRLEDLIDEGQHFPMMKYTLVDEEKILSVIDQMRITIPEQIEAASRLVNQRDRILAQANEEASRIVDYAKQKSEELTRRDSIVVAARHMADNLVAQAHHEAERIRSDADAYVVETLRDLESHLLRTLTIVRNGINKVLNDRQAAAQAQARLPQTGPLPSVPVAPREALTLPDTMPILKREEVTSGGQ
jgi:cell division septum initiation protein DivIVA